MTTGSFKLTLREALAVVGELTKRLERVDKLEHELKHVRGERELHARKWNELVEELNDIRHENRMLREENESYKLRLPSLDEVDRELPPEPEEAESSG